MCSIKENICCLVSKKDPLTFNVDRTYYFNFLLPIYKFYTKYIHTALKYLPFYVFTLHLDLIIFFFFLSPKHNRRDFGMPQNPAFFHALYRFSSFFLRMERIFIFWLAGF